MIVLDNLRCTGSESRLIDCPHNGPGSHNCSHSDDTGVRCSGITSCIQNYSCLSVTGGQRKLFDLEIQEAVYLAIERWKLELGDLCEWQS